MKLIPLAGVIAAVLAGTVHAEVILASPFTDHMVLQQHCPLPIWGTAEPGEKVTIRFGAFEASAAAGPDGRWRIDLPPQQASAQPRVITVRGSTGGRIRELRDVLVGEVWLASGQSNMDFTVSKKVKYFAGVTNEGQEIAAADHPLLRMFTGRAAKAFTPQNRVEGEWQVCSPATVPAFSAVAYFFARDLQRRIHVPVGMVTLAFGASTAEAWIRRGALQNDPRLRPTLERFDAAVRAFRERPPPQVEPPPSEDVAAGDGTSRRRRKSGTRDPVQDQHNPTVLFNGMIQPVIPYAIRGVIWYQGESIVGGNAGLALYPHVQQTLVRDWRRLWDEGAFPFLIVQLAGQQAASNRPEVREAQATLLDLEPNTGMAVTTDIGEAHNVHPHDKQDVGDRLARIALAQVYGEPLEYSGPLCSGLRAESGALRIEFSHVDGGLVARGGGFLRGFEVAGVDGIFAPADAHIEGATVVVRSARVSHPVAVRYAWTDFPADSNLANASGLPAPQFRRALSEFTTRRAGPE